MYLPSLCSIQDSILTQYWVLRVSNSMLQMEQATFMPVRLADLVLWCAVYGQFVV
jgi:hypothetical protein